MSMTLDTPEQIGMWVLLSRRHQVQLHLKGLKVPGIVKWGKENFPDAGIRTAKDMIVPIEFAISNAGGEIDFNLVNVRVLVRKSGLLFNQGVFNDLSEVEANPRLVRAYNNDNLEIVLTLDPVAAGDNEIMVPA